MKKEELRKVSYRFYRHNPFKLIEGFGYFHQWGMEYRTVETTPISENMYDEKKEFITVGIIEDEKTGQVYTVSPDSITFLNN